LAKNFHKNFNEEHELRYEGHVRLPKSKSSYLYSEELLVFESPLELWECLSAFRTHGQASGRHSWRILVHLAV